MWVLALVCVLLLVTAPMLPPVPVLPPVHVLSPVLVRVRVLAIVYVFSPVLVVALVLELVLEPIGSQQSLDLERSDVGLLWEVDPRASPCKSPLCAPCYRNVCKLLPGRSGY